MKIAEIHRNYLNMMNMNKLSLLPLWQKAIPIKEARFHFAPEHLTTLLAECPAPTILDMMRSLTNPNKLPHVEKMARAEELMDRQKQHFKIMREIHGNLWQMLRDNRLQCLAFEAPRSASAEPIEIPCDLMEYYPDWEKGVYKHSGLNLIELRVIKVEPKLMHDAPDMPATTGRPSFKIEILEAFAVLQSEGRFIEKPLTHGVEQIRVWIKTHKPESRAAQSKLSYDTISNAIKHLLVNDDKSKNYKVPDSL